MSSHTAQPQSDPDKGIRIWLYSLCLLIFVMIVVGGATRLTDSGLSITEWKPILGIIPPLDASDWQDAFAKYKEIPEYKLINKGMSLAEFKFIFWWEWGHRFLGRMIGFAFLVPFLFFCITRRIRKSLLPKLAVMFILGGLQGALGWYMVASGLVDRVDVSQYRLAAHLCAAFLIFGYIFWVALSLRPDTRDRTAHSRAVMFSAIGLLILISLQIALGALVAGLDAGMGYNTWPLMDGTFVPDGLGSMSPWYLNIFENALTVQFNHRMVAYAVVLWVFVHSWLLMQSQDGGRLDSAAKLLLISVLVQAALGIWTLLAQVQIGVALFHQGGAVVLFAAMLMHLHRLPGPSQAESA